MDINSKTESMVVPGGKGCLRLVLGKEKGLLAGLRSNEWIHVIDLLNTYCQSALLGGPKFKCGLKIILALWQSVLI